MPDSLNAALTNLSIMIEGTHQLFYLATYQLLYKYILHRISL